MSDFQPTSDKLVDLWMHQDSLVWSRVKVALLLQAGITAGWYYSMTDDLPEIAAPLALFGAILVLLLLVAVQFDISARASVRVVLTARGASLPFGGGRRWIVGLAMVALLACGASLGWYSIKYPHSMAAPTADDSNDTASYRTTASRAWKS